MIGIKTFSQIIVNIICLISLIILLNSYIKKDYHYNIILHVNDEISFVTYALNNYKNSSYSFSTNNLTFSDLTFDQFLDVQTNILKFCNKGLQIYLSNEIICENKTYFIEFHRLPKSGYLYYFILLYLILLIFINVFFFYSNSYQKLRKIFKKMFDFSRESKLF